MCGWLGRYVLFGFLDLSNYVVGCFEFVFFLFLICIYFSCVFSFIVNFLNLKDICVLLFVCGGWFILVLIVVGFSMGLIFLRLGGGVDREIDGGGGWGFVGCCGCVFVGV